MDREESIFLNSKKYKDIAEKRSIIFSEVEKALEIVKKFIIQKKRLIYGGMCIDLNLKLSGHPGIYPPDAIPDFDFMSPDFYQDSIELANILYENGLSNVSAINALHVNSRKVRVNFAPVADISYIPQNIYEQIPFITIPAIKPATKGKKLDPIQHELSQYQGLRVVHPDFQRLDLHRSFNIPFANPPQEVILHRLEKDQKRFRLIDQQYPIVFKAVEYDKFDISFPKEYLDNAVIGGLLGYAFLLKFVRDLISEKSILSQFIRETGVEDYIQEKLNKTIQIEVEINNKTCSLKSTPDERINIITDDFQELIDRFRFKNKQVKYYNKYLDNVRPRTIIVDDFENKIKYEIFDNSGELLPCYNLQKTIDVIEKLMRKKRGQDEIKNETKGSFDKIYLAQPNVMLMYFLQKSFEDKKDLWLALYQSTINLVEIAEKIILATEEQELTLANKIYRFLPFFLSAQTYGENNWSADYISNIKEKKYFLSGSKFKNLRPPFGFYPENETPAPEFNPQESELYQLDGLLRQESFEKISLDI